MLAYICDRSPEGFTSKTTFPCGPKDGSFIMRDCRTMIGGWASGAPVRVFEKEILIFDENLNNFLQPIQLLPQNIGMPFTPEMSGKKIVLQVHYDNAEHSRIKIP